MDIILEPCPFCGNKDIHLRKEPVWEGNPHYDGKFVYDIHCDICGCTNTSCRLDDLTGDFFGENAEEMVIKSWNERVVVGEEDTNTI